MWKWYDSKIIKIENETPSTKRFWLKILGDEPFIFKAGQFVTMDLPISEKRLKRWRSYSIANAPDTEGGDRVLEFCIVQAENSTGGSQYLCEQATVGTPIRFKGPDGTFTLKEPLDNRDIVLICTGTGVAPFRSMILDVLNRGIPFKSLHLIFGTRYEKDILYRKELEDLAERVSNFKYEIVLSRESEWTGRKGYVHEAYTEGYSEKRPNVDFYICGWSNMIDDVVAKLIVEFGYDKSQVHYELYG